MVDRLEMAKQYVQEMVHQRDDIVGAFVVGSVARGEATDASDIDLLLIVERAEGFQRGGTATWRDGVYIEAALVPRESYGDAEAALRDRVAAGHLRDALILHDPTGLFTCVQKEVRARFMEPRWLGLRVHHQLGRLNFALTSLQDAVAEGDPLGVCWAHPLAMWVAAAPLLINGISPSSTRGLVMVEAVAPELKDRICTWEGSTQLGPEGVAALMPLAEKCQALQETVGSEEWGQGFGYMLRKGEWFAEKGMYREALHMMGFMPAGMAATVRENGDPAVISRARELAREWFRAVGWEGQDVLGQKVRMAEEMVAEVEAMAAHLPSEEE